MYIHVEWLLIHVNEWNREYFSGLGSCSRCITVYVLLGTCTCVRICMAELLELFGANKGPGYFL